MKKIRPLQAVKNHCLNCVGGVKKEVEECDNPWGSKHECLLHPFRFGKNSKEFRFKLKIIKSYCTWCQGDNAKEIKNCLSPECQMYPFRLGKKPR